MIEFKHILCPIDFSETSARALTYATAFAVWSGADLEVLHVVPAFESARVPTASEPVEHGGSPLSRDEVLAEIRRAIAAAGAGQVGASAIAQEGRPHEAIVARAQAQRADLLVMGTHGRSGFSRLLLGSVTEKVLRLAPCPVLTVPPSASTVAGAAVALQRILCPIDYSPSALKALRYALALARQPGGSLVVLYALEHLDPEEPEEALAFEPCGGVVGSRRRRQRLVTCARERLHAELADAPAGCDITEVTAVGRAYRAILRQASEMNADLIVMGAQGTGGLELMLYGSNTQHVLRASVCPVLTVHA